MEQQEQNLESREQLEELEDFAGMKFKGLAADVIGYAKNEICKWRRIAFILAAAVVIEAAILAAVIIM